MENDSVLHDLPANICERKSKCVEIIAVEKPPLRHVPKLYKTI